MSLMGPTWVRLTCNRNAETIDWQSATKLNANDNDSFADIRLAA